MPRLSWAWGDRVSKIRQIQRGYVYQIHSKTQTAIEYAYRRQTADPQLWVFWVRASRAVRLEESYRYIAQRVGIQDWADPRLDLLGIVREWLLNEHNGRWTMIVDDLGDCEVFSEQYSNEEIVDPSGLVSTVTTSAFQSLINYLPRAAHGSILATTRNRLVAEELVENTHDVLDVEPMTAGEAAAIVAKQLRDSHYDADRSEMRNLTRELNYEPQAIVQAVAYINRSGSRMTFTRYLDGLITEDLDRKAFLHAHFPATQRWTVQASNCFLVTWYISFEHIRCTHSAAAQLLALVSLFDNERIPLHLLQGQYYIHRDPSRLSSPALSAGSYEQAKFEDDLATLQAYSFINVGVDDRILYIHQLVRDSTQKWLELHDELVFWQNRYIDVLDVACPTTNCERWPVWQEFFPHVEALLSFETHGDQERAEKRAAMLYRGSCFAHSSQRRLVAGNMARANLKTREQHLDASDIRTLDSISNLAGILRAQGQFDEAEELGRRALSGWERKLGSSHPRTLTSISNLAVLMHHQGKYNKAEELSRQALTGRERVLGTSHRSTLASLNNLALVLWRQGRCVEAEALSRQALVAWEKKSGLSHSNTLTSVYCLARLLRFRGKREEALQLVRRAIEACTDEFGSCDPRTLTCRLYQQTLEAGTLGPSMEVNSCRNPPSPLLGERTQVKKPGSRFAH